MLRVLSAEICAEVKHRHLLRGPDNWFVRYSHSMPASSAAGSAAQAICGTTARQSGGIQVPDLPLRSCTVAAIQGLQRDCINTPIRSPRIARILIRTQPSHLRRCPAHSIDRIPTIRYVAGVHPSERLRTNGSQCALVIWHRFVQH